MLAIGDAIVSILCRGPQASVTATRRNARLRQSSARMRSLCVRAAGKLSVEPSVAPSVGPSVELNRQPPTANRQASLIGSSSFRLTRPTRSPRRSDATAVVCSMSTCVASVPIVIVGRKIRGCAERDVGATRMVESNRSSDCITTAYRAPRCSLPRVSRGRRRR